MYGPVARAHLESLVLQNALDGSILARRGELCLEDNPEGSVANNLALCVLHISSQSGDAVLDFLADYLCGTRS